jgi:hypothetical protein
MYNSDTEFIFPIRIIPTLGSLRGDPWRNLVKDVSSPKTDETSQMAFVYMMVKLNGCVTCNTDSFRAMRGCTQCAWQTIRRYRGNDEELLHQFDLARTEVNEYLQHRNES